MNEIIQQNASKTIKSGKTKYFLTHLNNLPAESGRMTTMFGKSLRNDTANRMEPTSQKTILYLNHATRLVQNDRNHLPIGSLNIGIDVLRSGRNIYNHTWMKPQGPIVTNIPESNIANNCDIFDSVRKTLDIAYKVSP